PIFLGGIVALMVERVLRRTKASPERRAEVDRMGLLAAAGFITGEALLGIGLAAPIAIAKNADVLTVAGGRFASEKWPGLILVVVSLVLLYRLALKPEPKRSPR